MPRDPWTLSACLFLLRLLRRVVPRPRREEWMQEWEAELRHLSTRLHRRGDPGVGGRLDLLRRTLGALPDAAWLRRQLTADADLVRDLRLGARMFVRSPSFAVVMVLVLGLGLGSTGAIAAILDTLLLRPLPYPDADRIVTLWEVRAAAGRDTVAPADFLDWRERSRLLEHLAASIPFSFDLDVSGKPEVLGAALVTRGFFEAIGVRPLRGRLFLPEEFERGRDRVVLLTHGAWTRRFGADPGLVGRAITLDGEVFTVVGVLPPDFELRLHTGTAEREVWAPRPIQEHDARVRGSAWWGVVARLKPGVTLAQAQAEMEAISSALAAEHPRTNSRTRALVVPLAEHLSFGLRPALYALLGAVGLLMLATWATAAHLLLARAAAREREMAIRASLGASRGRLLRQLLAESGLLALLGGGLGLVFARWGTELIVALVPREVPRLGLIAFGWRGAAFVAVASAAAALLVGSAPAVHLWRRMQGGLHARASLRGPEPRLLRRGLVVGEVALAFVLLVGSGLLGRSLMALLSVDPGFRADHVLAAQVFAWDRNTTPDRLVSFFDRTLERITALPGVESAGAVSLMPFIEASIGIRGDVTRPDRPEASGEEASAFVTVATPGYFEAMRIPLRGGRLLDRRDRRGAAPVAIVNETLARSRFADEDPVGRRLRIGERGRTHDVEVVGVVAAVRHERLEGPLPSEVFLPHAQAPSGSMTYVVRTSSDPVAMLQAVKEQVWAEDPLQSFYRTATVHELVARTLAERRFLLVLVAAFALGALALACAGVYGLVSVLTEQRTREIGVRIALGARGDQVLALVLRQGAGLVAVGLVVGIAGAATAGPSLRSLLYGVSAVDPLTLVCVAAVLGVVGLAAALVPARRAARMDPTIALRAD